MGKQKLNKSSPGNTATPSKDKAKSSSLKEESTMQFLGKSLLTIGMGIAVVSSLRPAEQPLDVLSAARVDTLLANRTVLHLGGQHRGGTTILWRALVAAGNTHAADTGHISALKGFDEREACLAQRRFGCKGNIFGCSCMESEGLFVQSVMPTWRLDHATGDGLGRFALWNGTRLSEEDFREGDSERLFSEWAPLWGLQRIDSASDDDPFAMQRNEALENFQVEYLIEKTPSTTRTVRYLDRLWALPTAAGAQLQPARFLFSTRHPLAVALALESFTTSRGLTIAERVAHWLAVEESLAADLRAPVAGAPLSLQSSISSPSSRTQGRGTTSAQPKERYISYRKTTLERLTCQPELEISELLRWLGLNWSEARVSRASQAAASLVKASPNARYAAEYARRLADGGAEAARAHRELVEEFADRVAAIDTGNPSDRYDLSHIGGAATCRKL